MLRDVSGLPTILRAWLGRFVLWRNWKPAPNALDTSSSIRRLRGNPPMARLLRRRDSLLGAAAHFVQFAARSHCGRPFCNGPAVFAERFAVQYSADFVRPCSACERRVLCSLRARCFCANVEPARFLAALPVGAVCCRPGVCGGAGAFLVSRAVYRQRAIERDKESPEPKTPDAAGRSAPPPALG